MHAFLVSTGLVALAEIGDKTQILALMLAARFRRPLPIVFGILIATNLGFAWLASRARVLMKSRRAVMAANRTSGTLMIGAGAWVATR